MSLVKEPRNYLSIYVSLWRCVVEKRGDKSPLICKFPLSKAVILCL